MSTETPIQAPVPDAAPMTVAAPAVLVRSWKVPWILSVLSVVALIFFGILGESGLDSTFTISRPADSIVVEPIALPSRLVGILLAVLCVVIAAVSIWLVSKARRVPLWLSMLFGLAWIMDFLVWVAAGATIAFTGLLQGSLILAVPIIFGAMAGVLCERSGVVNISIEGQLLLGAFLGAVVASLTKNLYAGLFAAVIGGALYGALLAVFAIKYYVDQIIVGVVLNVLALGLTSFLYGQLLAEDPETWNTPGTFSAIDIPVLSSIPVIGPVLFQQTIIVYLMYIVVIAIQVFLFRSRWGLRVRAVGEHPQAADTVGINVNGIRYRTVITAGLVAGAGGAFLSLASAGSFGENMSSGKGFIALAAMIFGRWTPIGALCAALLFGFADNLQSVLTISADPPIPSEFLLMAPYLVTIFAVAGLVGRVRAPAADGVAYRKA